MTKRRRGHVEMLPRRRGPGHAAVREPQIHRAADTLSAESSHRRDVRRGETRLVGREGLPERLRRDTPTPGHRILLGYDASPGAERAAALLESRDWPDQTMIKVVSIPARARLPLSAFAGLSEARAHSRRAREILAQAQDDLIANLQRDGLQVDGELLPGPASTSIVDEAASFGSDLIVLGSRGHGPLTSLFLGSTSAHVGDRAACAVLVAREATCRRALLVIDASLGMEQIRSLLAFPAMLAGARLRLLVVTSDSPEYPRIAVSDAEMVEAYPASAWPSRLQAVEIADRLVRLLGDAGRSADVQMSAGDLVATVISTATEWRADLVIMATGPDPTPAAMLLGSTTNRILRGVTASVLSTPLQGLSES